MSRCAEELRKKRRKKLVCLLSLTWERSIPIDEDLVSGLPLPAKAIELMEEVGTGLIWLILVIFVPM
tara:strand:- start:149 stop:349 length:201 start_codon:yes stop_codon:yes gene_type:complete